MTSWNSVDQANPGWAGCPPGMRIFQTINQADGGARHENQERLRELARRGGDGLRLFCSHDPVQLERAQSAALSN